MKTLRIVALTAVLLSCNGKNDGGKEHRTPPSVLVMVDFSQSAAQLLPGYKKNLDEVISKISPGDRCVVGKIQKATEAKFEPFVDAVVPDNPGLMDVEEDVRDQQRAVRNSMRKAIDSVFSNPNFSPGTNILSALGLVKQVFPQSQRRVLVLLSDMQHSSSDFDLEKAAITDKFIDDTLARLQQAGRIPDLKGIAVYVAGATAKTDERYNLIKKFWEKLFAQAGADLKSYSHTLLNFSLSGE